MIVHQEKVSQQQHLLKQQQQQEQQHNKFALLSSLLSGDPGMNGKTPQTGSVRPAGEKVAKAMKRTAVLSTQTRQQPVSASLVDDSKTTTTPLTQPPTARLGKAVKHTAPIRACNSNIILNDQTNQLQKDRSNNLVLPNGQRLSGVRQTSLIASIQPARSSPSSTDQSSTGSSNKVTITTTYVYKRVTQEPEIDLNMECEEEEIEYIRRPAQVVVVETLPVNDDGEEKEDTLVKKKHSKHEEKESRSKDREEDGSDMRHRKRRGRPSEKTNSNTVEVKTKKPGRKPLSVTVVPETSKISKKTVTTATATTAAVSSVASKVVGGVSGFKSIFEKYYGRREGALQASMSGAGKSSFKKNLPYDLRVGRFPPKVMLNHYVCV